jgi:hypothetical protein
MRKIAFGSVQYAIDKANISAIIPPKSVTRTKDLTTLSSENGLEFIQYFQILFVLLASLPMPPFFLLRIIYPRPRRIWHYAEWLGEKHHII